eukprot:TRINITY_DN9246_c0_g1_i1.p1 TRINITY_DN9246_c0_g1~~TRINITY_DN9246_c0_g1_i1.p1  ORF type:complete len:283 (-),score=75.99 TRINITY_DN9246_c0_g1_i1:982-1830(-)
MSEIVSGHSGRPLPQPKRSSPIKMPVPENLATSPRLQSRVSFSVNSNGDATPLPSIPKGKRPSTLSRRRSMQLGLNNISKMNDKQMVELEKPTKSPIQHVKKGRKRRNSSASSRPSREPDHIPLLNIYEPDTKQPLVVVLEDENGHTCDQDLFSKLMEESYSGKKKKKFGRQSISSSVKLLRRKVTPTHHSEDNDLEQLLDMGEWESSPLQKKKWPEQRLDDVDEELVRLVDIDILNDGFYIEFGDYDTPEEQKFSIHWSEADTKYYKNIILNGGNSLYTYY